MTGTAEPICVQDPNLGAVAVVAVLALTIGSVATAAVVLVAVWLYLDAPAPARLPRPSWRRQDLKAIAVHTRAHFRRRVAAQAGEPPSEEDLPTVPMTAQGAGHDR